ncbi:hypothetical protein L0244_12945 [bacterium]|nr:hypothetical protein [bacterium]
MPTQVTAKRYTKFLVFVVSLVLSLMAAEIVGRKLELLPAPPSEAYIKLTEVVGRLPAPHSHSRFAEPGEFNTLLNFNAMGFRNQRTDFPKDVSGKRILAVGDSFTTAWEVEINQRWTEQMERFHPDWSILNVGMRNWGIDQTYLNLVNYPLEHQPDIVLLMFFTGNDVSDNYRPGILKTPWDAPHFLPANPDHLDSFNDLRKVDWSGYENPFDEPGDFPFPRNINAWLRLNSVVYRGIDQTRQLIQKKTKNAFKEEPSSDPSKLPVTWGVFSTGEDTPEWKTAWKITEILLQQMKVESEKRKAQFMIVVAPFSPLIEADYVPEDVKKKGLLDSAKYNLEKPATRLIEFGKKNNIPVLDLASGLIEFRKANPGRKLFFPKDGHFTALGNCVVGGLITKWIDPQKNANLQQCQ